MNTPKICAVVFSLLIASLAGCAAKSISNDFSFKNDSSEGIVVFSVSHDLSGSKGARAIFYLDDGAMGRIGDRTVYSLDDFIPGIAKDSEFDDSYGHIVALALPVGRHKFVSWQITNGTGLRIYP